jgi:hypothetical protein
MGWWNEVHHRNNICMSDSDRVSWDEKQDTMCLNLKCRVWFLVQSNFTQLLALSKLNSTSEDLLDRRARTRNPMLCLVDQSEIASGWLISKWVVIQVKSSDRNREPVGTKRPRICLISSEFHPWNQFGLTSDHSFAQMICHLCFLLEKIPWQISFRKDARWPAIAVRSSKQIVLISSDATSSSWKYNF